MTGSVLDSSAVLAALFEERGSDRVEAHWAGAEVSAVSLAEIVGKLVDRGYSNEEIAAVLAETRAAWASFEESAAIETGLMRRVPGAARLSLADRACLALGRARGALVVTADRAWGELDIDVRIELIR